MLSLGGKSFPDWKLVYHNPGNLDGLKVVGAENLSPTVGWAEVDGGICLKSHTQLMLYLPTVPIGPMRAYSIDVMIRDVGLNKMSWMALQDATAAVGMFAGNIDGVTDPSVIRVGTGVEAPGVAVDEWVTVGLIHFAHTTTTYINGERVCFGYTVDPQVLEGSTTRPILYSRAPNSSSTEATTPLIKNIRIWEAWP